MKNPEQVSNAESFLSGREPPKGMSPKTKKPKGLILSFFIMFAMPAIAATIYFGLIASDRYAASAGFSIRSMDQQGGLDLFGGLTGMASAGSTMSDAYLVMSYLASKDLVSSVDEDVDLRAIYASPDADFIYRTKANLKIEELRDHWERRTTVTHDTSSGIIQFEVVANSPIEAKRIADSVLFHVESLINTISDQAREDALRSATSEAHKAEVRLSSIMKDLQDFRSENGDIDPATTAGARIELVSSLEAQLSSVEARLFAASEKLDPNAPTIEALKRQANALQQQINLKKDSRAGDIYEKSEVLSEYETLQIQKAFAQKAYASAMGSLEAARLNADAQQRYLAIFMQPTEAQMAEYPKRLISILMYSIYAFALWGIASLVTYAVRDHMS